MSNPAPLVIAMPSRTTPTKETLHALRANTGPHVLLTVTGKPVDEARNELAQRVLAMNPVPEFVVWIDDDAWWLRGAVEALVNLLRARRDLAMLAGGFSRRLPHSSAIARRIAGDASSELRPVPPGVAGGNCFHGEIVPIAECGFHACALRTSALRALGPEPFAVTTISEDLAFCARLRAHGFGIACAPAATFAHVDATTRFAYLPLLPPMKIEHGAARPITPHDLRGVPGIVKVVPFVENGRRGVRVEQRSEAARTYGPAVDRAVKARSRRVAA